VRLPAVEGVSEPGRVLVTGATGFVGRFLVQMLVNRGWKVKATGRDASRRPPDCEFYPVDFHTAPDFDSLLDDVDAVVHLAARVHVMRETATEPLAAFRRANVSPTGRLADAAARHAIRHFVYLSSIKVNGEETRSQPFTEADAPRPGDPYAVSKLEAERLLAERSAATGLPVSILRPPLIYGPGVGGNFARLLELIERRLPLPLRNVNNRRSLLYVDNLCDAIAAILALPATGTKTYLVSDSTDLSTPELVRKLASALDRSVLLLPVPVSLLRIAGSVSGRGAELRRLTESLVIDSSCIRRQLAWHPPHDVEEGLAATANAFRRRNDAGTR
jgi:nucleoside-diphosphate-sugar epimerase